MMQEFCLQLAEPSHLQACHWIASSLWQPPNNNLPSVGPSKTLTQWCDNEGIDCLRRFAITDDWLNTLQDTYTAYGELVYLETVLGERPIHSTDSPPAGQTFLIPLISGLTTFNHGWIVGQFTDPLRANQHGQAINELFRCVTLLLDQHAKTTQASQFQQFQTFLCRSGQLLGESFDAHAILTKLLGAIETHLNVPSAFLVETDASGETLAPKQLFTTPHLTSLLTLDNIPVDLLMANSGVLQRTLTHTETLTLQRFYQQLGYTGLNGGTIIYRGIPLGVVGLLHTPHSLSAWCGEKAQLLQMALTQMGAVLYESAQQR